MTFRQTLTQNRKSLFAGTVALLAAVGIGIATLAGAFDSGAQTALPTLTFQTPAESTPTPAPTVAPLTEVNIAATKTMPYTPVWNPPDGGENFWQIVDPANGYPQTGGTDYVLAHACVDRECVGNQIRTLNVGDTLTYHEETYVVQDKLQIHKSQIANQDIWHHDADRLVVITCILNPDTGGWDENEIIVATRHS